MISSRQRTFHVDPPCARVRMPVRSISHPGGRRRTFRIPKVRRAGDPSALARGAPRRRRPARCRSVVRNWSASRAHVVAAPPIARRGARAARTPRDAKRISDRPHRGRSYHATRRRAGAWRRTQPLGVVVEPAGITRTVIGSSVVLRGGSTAGGRDRHPAGGGRPTVIDLGVSHRAPPSRWRGVIRA